MKKHVLDGARLLYRYRGSWKANLFHPDGRIELVPVTWTPDLRPRHGTMEQSVWVTDPMEFETLLVCREPFLIAVADPRDDAATRREFKKFAMVLEVVATGESVAGRTRDGLKARVLRRVYG